MRIKLNATGGENAAISANNQYYVAFYDKKRGGTSVQSAYLDFASIKSFITDSSKGFILAYTTDGKLAGNIQLTANSYYVWDGSSWIAVTTDPSDPDKEYTDFYHSNRLMFSVNHINGDGTYSWRVRFDKNFGSKDMYTPTFITTDSNNIISAFQEEITPTPLPVP